MRERRCVGTCEVEDLGMRYVAKNGLAMLLDHALLLVRIAGHHCVVAKPGTERKMLSV
jgi:hypothetical protein